MRPAFAGRFDFFNAYQKGNVMIDKVLVAVDGSSHSLKAVEYAAEIGAGCDARVHILTVLKPQQSEKVSKELRDFAQLEHMQGSDLDTMKQLSKDLLAHAAGIARERGVKDVAASVEVGPTARTIVEIAAKEGSSMIVIGSRGLGNIEATLRGGVSHPVLLVAKCPVLTVK